MQRSPKADSLDEWVVAPNARQQQQQRVSRPRQRRRQLQSDSSSGNEGNANTDESNSASESSSSSTSSSSSSSSANASNTAAAATSAVATQVDGAGGGSAGNIEGAAAPAIAEETPSGGGDGVEADFVGEGLRRKKLQAPSFLWKEKTFYFTWRPGTTQSKPAWQCTCLMHEATHTGTECTRSHGSQAVSSCKPPPLLPRSSSPHVSFNFVYAKKQGQTSDTSSYYYCCIQRSRVLPSQTATAESPESLQTLKTLKVWAVAGLEVDVTDKSSHQGLPRNHGATSSLDDAVLEELGNQCVSKKRSHEDS